MEPKTLRPLTPLFPPRYDENAICKFHVGLPGRSVENCKAFKFKVQDLIDSKLLTFKEEGPDVKGNPMHVHFVPFVDVVGESVKRDVIKEVRSVKSSLSMIHEKLWKHGMIPEVHTNCEICMSYPNNCEELRRCHKR